VLRGNMYVQNHCYRADEMAQMIDLAHEFGFKIRSFHHAVESYKIADLLAKEGTSVSVWADWWGFKEEAMDGIQQNAALNQQAGGRPIIHSDDPGGIQRLNQEAAKAMYAGQRAGILIARDRDAGPLPGVHGLGRFLVQPLDAARVVRMDDRPPARLLVEGGVLLDPVHRLFLEPPPVRPDRDRGPFFGEQVGDLVRLHRVVERADLESELVCQIDH